MRIRNWLRGLIWHIRIHVNRRTRRKYVSRLRKIAATTILAPVLIASANAQDCTLTVPRYPTDGQSPLDVVSADLDGDGLLDMVTANSDSNDVSILIALGNRAFAEPVKYDVGVRPSAIITADVDSDGVKDILTANFDSNDVSVLLGMGDGTFSDELSFAAGPSPTFIAAADFDNDSVLDIVVVNFTFSTSEVSVLTGLGDGSFGPREVFAAGDRPRSVVTGDFNGDQNIDLVVSNSLSDDVSLLVGLGDGDFQQPVNFPVGAAPLRVLANDFNGDGELDLLTSNFNVDTVSVLIGTGNGDFAPQDEYSVGDGPIDLTTADFNNDGFLDFVVNNRDDDYCSVFRGNGDGTFQAPQTVVPGTTFGGIDSGDLDSDGMVDIAATDTSGNVSVLFGVGGGDFLVPINTFATLARPTSIVAGDFNNDLIMDIAVTNNKFQIDGMSVFIGRGNGLFDDPEHYQTSYDPRSLSAADFNNDGELDLVAVGFAPLASVYLGQGDGTFTDAINTPVGDPDEDGLSTVKTADFNGDGIIDIAVSKVNSYQELFVLLGTGNGQFGSSSVTSVDGIRTLVAGDFDGDGFADIATQNYDKYTYGASVSVFLGNGQGGFAGPQESIVQDGQWFTQGDFNDDGLTDLAIQNRKNDTISILTSQGNGTFSVQDIPSSIVSISMDAGDVNNDGFLDLATTRGVLLGNGDGSFEQVNSGIETDGGPMVLVDFDLDDRLDIAYGLGSLPAIGTALWNCDVILPGDVNQDGAVNLLDVAPFVDLLVNGEYLAEADINEDGVVDLLDVPPFVDLLSGG